jgi:hypothetical protein
MPVTELTPTLRNLQLSDITVSRAESAVLIQGLPENPIENLTLRSLIADSVKNGVSCSNVKGLVLETAVVKAEAAPALSVTASRDVEVVRFAAGTPAEQSADMRFERTENVMVQSCKAPPGSRALLELKGSANRGITMALNRVHEGTKDVALTDGASESIVERRN